MGLEIGNWELPLGGLSKCEVRGANHEPVDFRLTIDDCRLLLRSSSYGGQAEHEHERKYQAPNLKPPAPETPVPSPQVDSDYNSGVSCTVSFGPGSPEGELCS